ncbi:MAG TPA: RseA family anti-sigma factor [Candidatus Berkiella sp.]|nr:RseA family anti-sigma factor [Candidatus Berkiella sp.]
MQAKDVKDNRDDQLEAISAMLDDELSLTEKNQLLTQIKADAVLQEKWRHYSIVKTILRKKSQAPTSIKGFVNQVIVHSTLTEESHIALSRTTLRE